MTTATSRQVIRRLILDRHPELGFYATADSVTTTTIVDLSEFGHIRYGGDSWADMYMYRPERTGNDIIKIATTVNVTTGALTHGGTNYSNTADTEYEIIGPMSPDDFNMCIVRAQRHSRFNTHIPFTVFTDADMETSGVGSWTGTNATPTKSVVAADIFSGTQALNIVTSAQDGYAQGVTFRTHPSTQIYTSCIGRAETGTLSLQLFDVTNSVAFGTAVTYSGEEYGHLWRVDTTPSTCEEMAIRLVGTAASNELDVDCVMGPYRRNVRRVELPSYIDEAWKLQKLRPAKYEYSVPGSTQVHDAYSRYWEGDEYQPGEYETEQFHREANPYQMLLRKGLEQQDYWLEVQRPWYDVDTLSTEAATTTAPLEQLLDVACREVFSLLHNRDPENPAWTENLAKYTQYAAVEEVARTPQPTKRQQRVTFIRA